MMPREFPPYSTVYFYYRSWQVEGVWECINEKLTNQMREQEGKDELPTVVAVDSQSVKTTGKRGSYRTRLELTSR